MSYDMIDRFLRNNLDDDNYAEYSAALDELCTPPAQRTWVGLTDEEVEEVWKRVEASDFRDVVQPFAQAIEVALRSRNENNN